MRHPAFQSWFIDRGSYQAGSMLSGRDHILFAVLPKISFDFKFLNILELFAHNTHFFYKQLIFFCFTSEFLISNADFNFISRINV